MRRVLVAAVIVVAGVRGPGATQAAQSAAGAATPAAIQVEPVQKNIFLLASAGSGNITVQVGSEGVLMVDSGIDRSAPQVLAAIQKLSTGRVRYIINTHAHPDHVGGNGTFGKLAGSDPADALKIIGQQNVLNRLTHPAAGQPRFPEEGLPYDEYSTAFKSMYFNGEAVLVYHEANAHTDGDSVVMFRGSDVISAGDVFTPGAYPFLDLDRGGSVQGEIAALNHILDLAVPARTQEGGTYIVPGHGRICDEADVVEFRDMIVIVRDRIRDLIGKGMTLEQVKAARPSRDYDTEYVTTSSFVSADRFVESVYTSLKKAAAR
jgi:glyoxylase-like metal-dependent hydrolase (beta-lactamase superfamily II)